jgi:hypothetical protein
METVSPGATSSGAALREIDTAGAVGWWMRGKKTRPLPAGVSCAALTGVSAMEELNTRVKRMARPMRFIRGELLFLRPLWKVDALG